MPAGISSPQLSDLSPSPSPDDGAHVVMVAAGEIFVEDGLGPEYSQDSPTVLVVESG